MNADLEIIKRKYGEGMMHLCRDNLGKILEFEGLLPKLLDDNFYPFHGLAEDIVKQSKLFEFIQFMLFKSNIKDEEVYIDTGKSAKELFADAGYILYPECQTEEDIQSFRHYYQRDDNEVPVYKPGVMPLLDNGEELCTFRGGRLITCRVWFAVKMNVHKIKREDFKHPNRQDAYGTSVLSIQFTKGENTRLSIKNRYNHKVDMPDNTFNSNLEQIAKGLTVAFEKDFNVRDKIASSGCDLELENYVVAYDGKRYPYNYEINNIYYCPNNIIIDNFVVKHLPTHQKLIDYYILSYKNKSFSMYDTTIDDCFVKTIGDGVKSILLGKDDMIKIIRHDGSEVIMEVNRKGQMISIKDEYLSKCGDGYLRNLKYLSEINLPRLEFCGNSFLKLNKDITHLYLPQLRKCGDAFVPFNKNLKIVELPLLEECGFGFLCYNETLSELKAPGLRKCSHKFMFFNDSMQKIDFPLLRECGDYFLQYNTRAKRVNLPQLRKCGGNFMNTNKILDELFMPSLEECGDNFLESNKSIKKIVLPKFKKAGISFLSSNKVLEEIDLPMVNEMQGFFLFNLNWNNLKKINASEQLKQYWINAGISSNKIEMLKNKKTSKKRNLKLFSKDVEQFKYL